MKRAILLQIEPTTSKRRILEDFNARATALGNFILSKSQLRVGGGTGICIQSYLKRSQKDIQMLSKSNAVIRLVKGAYHSDENRSYKSRAETTENYVRLMQYLFMHSNGFAIATHDLDMIAMAKQLNAKYHRNVWYAMLNGIRNKYAIRLARESEQVEVYLPFGSRWICYSYRRLKEASNLSLVIKSLFESQRI